MYWFYAQEALETNIILHEKLVSKSSTESVECYFIKETRVWKLAEIQKSKLFSDASQVVFDLNPILNCCTDF